MTLFGLIMREIDCAHSRSLKMLPWPWIRESKCAYWSENRKILKFLPENHISEGSFMRGIDCAYSQSLKTLTLIQGFKEMSTYWIFALIHTLISLNQDQGSIFKLRECARSIPHMKLPPEICFWERNFKIFRFLLQYTHLFPWIRVKEAFSRFGNARNRFFAWFYLYISCFGKKIFDRD